VAPRRTAILVVVVLLATTAACSTTPKGSPTGPSASATPSLSPWQGTLAATTLPSPVQALRGVACPAARRCWAVGSTFATSSAPAGAALLSTSDGGATWTEQTAPATVGYLSAIACSSTRTCTAVGQVGLTGVGPGAIVTTADGGSTWTLDAVPTGTTDVTAVDCRPTGSCMALGVVSGRVTTLTPSPSGPWVAGGALPASASAATGLSCTDGTHCWATAAQLVDVGHVLGAIAATSDGGATWALEQVPVGTGALQGIACTPGSKPTGTPADAAVTSGARCAAVGTTASVLGGPRSGQGVVLTSTDGGVTWKSAPVTPTAADLLGVSCTAGACVAVGTTVASTPQAGVLVLSGTAGTPGVAWRQAVTAPVALPLTAVDCVSLAACVAVGESGSVHLAATDT
jgi:hypothetical protein